MKRVKTNRKVFTGAALVAILATLGVVQGMLDQAAAQAKQVPRFEVDPFWPKPMPNNYVFGQTIGLGISSDDHVWIIHRGNDPANLDRTELAMPTANGPRVNAKGGKAFADFMLAPETQAVIKSFGLDKYGQPLFVPVAGKKDEDL